MRQARRDDEGHGVNAVKARDLGPAMPEEEWHAEHPERHEQRMEGIDGCGKPDPHSHWKQCKERTRCGCCLPVAGRDSLRQTRADRPAFFQRR